MDLVISEGLVRIRVLRLLSQDVVSTGHQNWEIFSLRFKSLVVFSDLRNKVLALVNILKAQSIVSKKKGHEQYSYFQIFLPYELDVVVVSDSPGAVISDPVDNSYANVLNGPQQVLIGNQVSGECFNMFLLLLISKRSFVHLHTALLLVPLMSWERWLRKTPSAELYLNRKHWLEKC